MVAYGTDVIRKIDKNWWIDQLERNLILYEAQELIPIVTDVRYPNEMEWIQKEKNGVCVYITRKGIGPANKEEKRNNSILKKQADYRIMWPTFEGGQISEGDKYVRRVINKILKTKIKCNPTT